MKKNEIQNFKNILEERKKAILENLQSNSNEIEDSLDKIKNGTYGICESCDDEIDSQRLKVKPHARYCITCRQIAEQGKKHEN
ncbi:TraR/DksA family transcriptional regulator [Campylobacter jejuni]|nr:TraR/DksA family transcriptional regulator [Campylobacter jejuni]EHD1345956.1 TraR/DksA family transcriptional regulator [Campylobacter jejuni]